MGAHARLEAVREAGEPMLRPGARAGEIDAACRATTAGDGGET